MKMISFNFWLGKHVSILCLSQIYFSYIQVQIENFETDFESMRQFTNHQVKT